MLFGHVVTASKLLNNSNCLHPERSEFREAERTKSKDLLYTALLVAFIDRESMVSIFSILRLRPAQRGTTLRMRNYIILQRSHFYKNNMQLRILKRF